MSEQAPVNIKQRVIGAIVLVSLAVIFLPMILKERSDYPAAAKTAEIPPMPEKIKAIQQRANNNTKPAAKKQPVLPKPKSIPSDQKNRQVVNKALSKPKESKKLAESKSSKVVAKAPKTRKITQSYAIQLGSFSSQKNAVDLKRKLQKSRYKAYIEVIRTSKGLRHRVRVGPYLKYDQIESIRKKINRGFKLNGKIVNYK